MSAPLPATGKLRHQVCSAARPCPIRGFTEAKRSLMKRLVVCALGIAFGWSGCRKPSEPFEMLSTPPPQTLQRHWPVPEFTLTERNGKTLTLADLRGKVWVADFFYTTCPGPCPMMTSRLSEIHQATRSFDDVRLVSISIDPVKDTPAVLQQYAAKFHADSNWKRGGVRSVESHRCWHS